MRKELVEEFKKLTSPWLSDEEKEEQVLTKKISAKSSVEPDPLVKVKVAIPPPILKKDVKPTTTEDE